MPKILERDPAWLSKPSVGFDLFQAGSAAKAQRSTEIRDDGPLRKIAHRGTEVFVAVGNEIRWSQLGLLRAAEDDLNRKSGTDGDERQEDKDKDKDKDKAYRVLKTTVARPITHLSVSPSGDYMVILTSHTCHVSILPAASHLRPSETAPLRLKTFQVGPTAHVLEQAPLVSALWHPLSQGGDSLVTVTLDACVRLWELDSGNRSSFNEPELAVDLKKLANATSLHTDFSTSKYGANKGFSPDDVEMQVAAACFGGQGGDDEHGWASMTLWFAMTEGDVYALCPFLPSTWRAPATLLPTLSTSVMEKAKGLSRDANATESEKRAVEQQSKWLADVDAQEPLLMPGRDDFETVEVYTRPHQLSAVPKLQGPFQISPEPDFGELTDIFVIAPKLDDDALYDDLNEETGAEEGLSVSIICLATSTNEIHVCLDVDGVEAEWLPNKRSRSYAFDDDAEWKELVLFQTVDLAQSEDEDDGYPTFSLSPNDRCELFVTHPQGVCSLSFRPWVSMLEDELSAPSDSGAGFRLNVMLDSTSTAVDQIVDIPHSSQTAKNINAALIVRDPDVGFIVLTSTPGTPYATILDLPHSEINPYAPDDLPTIAGALPAPEPRAPYRPAPEFDQQSALPNLLRSAQDKRLLGANDGLKAQIRFSPATLQLMTEAHRLMSTETHRLGMAAAELFRRCERMRLELQEQVRKVAEIAQRVDAVTGHDEDNDDAEGEAETAYDSDGEEVEHEREILSGKEKIDIRIEATRSKTEELNERLAAVRKKMLRLGGPQLSAKELVFAEEVGRLEKSILPAPQEPVTAEEEGGEEPPQSKNTALGPRYEAVKELKARLVEQAATATAAAAAQQSQEKASSEVGGAGSGSGGSIGSGFRKQKLAQVMLLLERETALVEAVMDRLKRLQGVA